MSCQARVGRRMDYDELIATAVRQFPPARDFERVFPGAEHSIVEAKRNFHADGWKLVHEWNSRAHLYDRYVFWLSVAIEIGDDDTISQLEKPTFYVVEVEPKGFSVSEADDGAWEQIVQCDGDLEAMGFEMEEDSPAPWFPEYWEKSRPPHKYPPDGMAFAAPYRYKFDESEPH